MTSWSYLSLFSSLWSDNAIGEGYNFFVVSERYNFLSLFIFKLRDRLRSDFRHAVLLFQNLYKWILLRRRIDISFGCTELTSRSENFILGDAFEKRLLKTKNRWGSPPKRMQQKFDKWTGTSRKKKAQKHKTNCTVTGLSTLDVCVSLVLPFRVSSCVV